MTLHFRPVLSEVQVVMAKNILAHTSVLSSYLFCCMPLLPVTVPCRIVFAKVEDLKI